MVNSTQNPIFGIIDKNRKIIKEGVILENKEQLFGTKAIDYRGSQFYLLSMVTRIFTLQNIKFWLLTYVVSVVIFQLFGWRRIDFINIILFPFSVILIGSIANLFVPSMPQLYRLLYPSSYKVLFLNLSKVWAVIMIIIKLIIYVIVWRYTFILGIVGLMITINNARKLIK